LGQPVNSFWEGRRRLQPEEEEDLGRRHLRAALAGDGDDAADRVVAFDKKIIRT
jgi:hypothetical protein